MTEPTTYPHCKAEIKLTESLAATVGMYGDLQGIAGKSLQEIEGLALSALALKP